MQPPDIAARLAAVAPHLPRALCAEIAARASRMAAPDGARLFGPGDPCRAYVIPLAGSVRVEHAGETGRTVVLYRVGPGDSCVMTASCLMAGTDYGAWGFAEGPLEALALSGDGFRSLLGTSGAFRDAALGTFARRIIELTEIIDELLLRRVDLRLAGWLAARPEAQVAATHQAMAAELGTAREVVSRTLKEFERRGWIALGRGAVDLRDRGALAAFAAAR